MTPAAVVMMIVAIAIIWGGLAAAAVFLVRNPLDSATHPHDRHEFDRAPADATPGD